MATLSAMAASLRPSAIILSASVAVTSAETGPGTTLQISAIVSSIGRPAFMMREGLVVTPSSKPVSANALISSMSAVSAKNFMVQIPEAVPLRLAAI